MVFRERFKSIKKLVINSNDKLEDEIALILPPSLYQCSV